MGECNTTLPLPILHVAGAKGGSVFSGAPSPQGISRALAAVVSRSSLRQGAKGLVTAGILKSVSYSLAKVTQAIAGRRKRREQLPPKS